MDRIFWLTCPRCEKAFSVDYGIRYADVQFECPHCREKFRAEQAAAIDERA
jgi:transposase-like protein